jgi:uncharacterized membrane protein HdeD (DUF308 family)|tara:strand:+ start:32 stop:397 length:366 start_codon:yes stop_codon:yes gene_type:complete
MFVFDILKIIIIAFIYGTLLIFTGPLIDHAFTDLHKDEDNWEILFEIITHIIAIAIFWYYLNNGILSILNPLMNVKNMESIDTVISITSGLLLVGLQSHLKRKLQYITHEHPFRVFQFFDK